jgi:hypothetical protein
MTHPTTTPPADERIPHRALRPDRGPQTSPPRRPGAPALAAPSDQQPKWRRAADLANPCPASTPVDHATWLLLDKTVVHCPACRAYTLGTTRGMVPHQPKQAPHP